MHFNNIRSRLVEIKDYLFSPLTGIFRFDRCLIIHLLTWTGTPDAVIIKNPTGALQNSQGFLVGFGRMPKVGYNINLVV